MNQVEFANILDNEVRAKSFSGVVSIVRQETILYEKAFGYADRSNKLERDRNGKRIRPTAPVLFSNRSPPHYQNVNATHCLLFQDYGSFSKKGFNGGLDAIFS